MIPVTETAGHMPVVAPETILRSIIGSPTTHPEVRMDATQRIIRKDGADVYTLLILDDDGSTPFLGRFGSAKEAQVASDAIDRLLRSRRQAFEAEIARRLDERSARLERDQSALGVVPLKTLEGLHRRWTGLLKEAKSSRSRVHRNSPDANYLDGRIEALELLLTEV